MKRLGLAVSAACAAALAVGLFLLPPGPSRADSKETGKSSTAALLPISQVVLFSSGVGYFQREGTVEGAQRVDLSFPVGDVNDLIKSMTLRDLDGGHVSAVTYDSNVPVERTLKSFAVNLTDNPNFAQILNQARGEKVEVVLQQTNSTQPGTLTGSIIGVETKAQAVDKAVVNVEVLNLWCADGMRSLKLSEVQRVRFLNAIMDSEFKKALETLALGHDSQKKTVSIGFAGEGKRQVKVGYVVENPVWKTSYRLVLAAEKKDQKEAKKPYLQGWAVVENTTDEDWSGVRMALISGRPISFKMNLYDALFVQRPVVEPELFASLRPPSYSGALVDQLGNVNRRFEMKTKELSEREVAQERLGRLIESHDQDEALKKLRTAKKADEYMSLSGSVSSVASATKLGDYFQYAIDHAVTLPRQKSALLPIVTKDVEGDRVSIYNEGVHAKFPLLGLVFKNTTGMHLTQGPITVFEGSTYAGDARIQDLQKDERRLLSFAIDLGTEVHAVPHSDNGKLTSVKIVKGIAYTKTKIKESKTYTIANRNEVDRSIIIEHPHRTDFTLTTKEKPWETAADVHRFKVTVPAGKTEPYTVSEEKEFGSSVTLTNSDDHFIRVTINDQVTSAAVKEALRRALELRGKMATTQREIQQQQQQLNVITNDQARLRQNLREMPPTAAAYKRYLQKFDDQETQIEKYQADIKNLQEQEHAQRKDYEAFLANLNVE